MPDEAGVQPDERSAFDADAFYETVDGERRTRGLNWKEVAEKAGVSQSTLTRLGQGRRPDVDSFARLVAWGGFNADRFLVSPKMQQAGGFLTNLPTYLRSDPNLDDKGVPARNDHPRRLRPVPATELNGTCREARVQERMRVDRRGGADGDGTRRAGASRFA